jgi:putative ABC transport system ATP-binding protein
MSNPLVAISDLSKTFGEGETRVDAVRDVDLELTGGEIVLVMGPSGSGKTTLLSMLGGLLRPSAGEIRIDGVDIAGLSERELPPFRATRFGFIFQDFNLLAALTARENVEVALNLGGVGGQKARERAEELLVALGLAERLDFDVDQLSGGEKQRVAIARAIANHPQLIFADEPTANLDSAHGAETMRLLRGLAKDERTTVVIVSHDQRLREVADRVLWLEDGQLKHLEALTRDPVCGMLLDPSQAPASLESDSDTLYFCSRGCLDEYSEGQIPVAQMDGAPSIGRPPSG